MLKSSSSRWLAGFGVAALVLVVVAVAVSLTGGRGNPRQLPAGSAERAVQEFLLAIEDGRDREAFDMLESGVRDRCGLERFRNSVRFLRDDQGGRDRQLRVSLVDVKEVDPEVEVTVDVTRYYLDPPFGSGESSNRKSFLLQQKDGSWQFTAPPWPVFGCEKPATPLPDSTGLGS